MQLLLHPSCYRSEVGPVPIDAKMDRIARCNWLVADFALRRAELKRLNLVAEQQENLALGRNLIKMAVFESSRQYGSALFVLDRRLVTCKRWRWTAQNRGEQNNSN